MYANNILNKVFSTLFIVLICVHFIISLEVISDKISDEGFPQNYSNNKSETQDLEIESSHIMPKLLTDFPTPLYVSSESKKSKKSIKTKKKKKYELNREETVITEDNDEDQEYNNGSGNKYQGSKKTVIKYVPIPIYLPSKVKENYKPLKSMNSYDLGDLINMKMPDTSINGYNLMGTNGLNFDTLPKNFNSMNPELGLMAMNRGFGNYNFMDNGYRYNPMGNSMRKNQVIANYHTNYNSPMDTTGSDKSVNNGCSGNGCDSDEDIDTNEETDDMSNNKSITRNDNDFNGYHHIHDKNEPKKIKMKPLFRIKSKANTTPNNYKEKDKHLDEEMTNTELNKQFLSQNSDEKDLTKAKEIAKMLKILEKL